MNEYEILLLLDPDLDDDRQGEVVTRARELVESGGGTWDLHDVMGPPQARIRDRPQGRGEPTTSSISRATPGRSTRCPVSCGSTTA